MNTELGILLYCHTKVIYKDVKKKKKVCKLNCLGKHQLK